MRRTHATGGSNSTAEGSEAVVDDDVAAAAGGGGLVTSEVAAAVEGFWGVFAAASALPSVDWFSLEDDSGVALVEGASFTSGEFMVRIGYKKKRC